MFEKLNQGGQGQHLIIDLHGFSVKETKKLIAEKLKNVEASQLTQLYIITGWGKHVNPNGARGVLKKILPKLLKPYQTEIVDIHEEKGAYQVILKNHLRDKKLSDELFALIMNANTDEEKIRYLKKCELAAKSGDFYAQIFLAFTHLHQNVKGYSETEKGLLLLESAREKGFFEAAVILGELYFDGVAVPRDAKKAFGYFKEAAEGGNSLGQYRLAVCYLSGNCVIKDDKQGLFWIQKAADSGLSHAEYALGESYFTGDFTEQNLVLSLKYMQRAATKNVTSAQVHLGRCYGSGSYGVTQNFQQAFHYYWLAAQKNDGFAIYQVGTYLGSGRLGMPDHEGYFRWMRKGAELGDADCQAEIAINYFLGQVVREDIDKSMYWCKKALEGGSRGADWLMSQAHRLGKGVEHDPQKAFAYLTKAAEKGCQRSQMELEKWTQVKNTATSSSQGETKIADTTRSMSQGLEDAQDDLEIKNLAEWLFRKSYSGHSSFFSDPSEQKKNRFDPVNVSNEIEDRTIPVINATINNQLAEVKRLIHEEGADINTHAPSGGKTPLHIAVEFGYTEIISFLITAKADVNAVTQRKFTPLHVAAQKGNTQLVELLVKAGAEIDACSDVGCTPLHEAAANGQSEATQKLLALKANPNIKETRYHFTAANLANENQHTKIRDILCQSMSYSQCFIQNVYYVLFNWKKAFSPASAEYRFVNKLSESILGIEAGDEVFKKMSVALKSPEYLAVENKLKPLRALLIENMKQYNSHKLATMPPVFTSPPVLPSSSLGGAAVTQLEVKNKNPVNF